LKHLPYGAPALAALLFAAPAAAEPFRLQEALDAPAALKLSGSARARYETIGGQARAGLPSSETLASFRTILGAEYGAGPVRLAAELWDSRAYGGKTGGAVSTNEVNALELVQAYVAAELKAPLGEGSKGRLQLGRFMLNLGSRRFVAADDYRNTTNGSTGGRLDLETRSGADLTLFYVLPQLRRPDDQPALLRNQAALDRESDALRLWGALASAPAGRLGMVEAGYYGLHEGDLPGRPNRNRRLATFSARLIRNPVPQALDYEIEAAWQTGHVRADKSPAAADLDVSAGFVHLDAGYQLAGRWRPHLSAQYDWVSGDHGAGSYNRFDTLYGMRRADFAPSGIFNAIGRANISTPGLRLEVQPNRRADALISARAMWLASATDAFSTTGARDPAGRTGRHAGEMVEGRLRYWLVPDSVRFEADAAWLSKGRFLEEAPNANRTGDTAYLSLNLTASF
jgi:hypothetical protein